MSFDVIVCGSLHLDVVVKSPALPRLDETVVGSSWQQVCGGKGGNQAVQAAKAGARTAMLGRVGNDGFGAILIDNLTQSGVDCSGVSIHPELGSGMSVAILQDDGDYGAVIVSGANTGIDAAGLKTQLAALDGAAVLVLQNEVPEAVNIAAASVAAQQGTTVIFNAAPARTLSSALMQHVHVLIVNRVEAEAMAGVAVHDFASAHLALPQLRSVTCAVIITLGGAGLLVAPLHGDAVEIPAVPVIVTSTHGAGDCFVGVLAAQLAQKQSLLDACHVANHRAAAFVSRR